MSFLILIKGDKMTSKKTQAELADILYEEGEVVFKTKNHIAHVQDSTYGFDVSIYAKNARYDEDFEFDEECLDGGIIEDGDCLDAIAYAFEFYIQGEE